MNEELISVEKLIANDLAKLSLKEREEVYEDLHGVRDLMKETPELIKESLEKMELEIKKIEDKPAYEQALKLSEEFVTNQETRIKFLRADSFHPKKAAERFVRHFQFRLELFGTEYLAQHIVLEDLDKDTVAAIASGLVQVLQNRDNQGRAVVAGLASFFHRHDCIGEEGFRNWARAFFYIMLSLADDEETQKKGFVYVSYTIDQVVKSMATRRRILSMGSRIIRGLPVRLVGFHFCHNELLVLPLLSVIAYTAGAALSVRIRTHYGSHTDCQYALMSYGIPSDSFPITLAGELTLTEHEKWAQKRRLKEAYLRKTQNPSRSIDLPSRSDVLLGRGRPFNLHPGNRLLHEIVEAYFDQYNNARRDEKTKLAQEIIGIVHKYNGHFLKQNPEAGVWMEVSHLEARNKVNHSFRRKREFDSKGMASSSSTRRIKIEADGQGKRRKATQ